MRLPTEYGEFMAIAFREKLTGKHHVALVHGDVDGAEDVLVRVHSECLTGDVFHSLRCDCGEQLDTALRRIAAEERGVLLYMAQEGRGIGLLNKLRRTSSRSRGSTPSRRTSRSASPPTSGSAGSATRSSPTSG